MHDMSMTAGEQRKCTAGADHIHGLPQAIQNEHRLVESNFHTG